MFKWPGVPSPLADEHELADFVELSCWQTGFTSAVALERSLGRVADYEHSGGVEEEEEIPRYAQRAYSEIQRRIEACGEGYPFCLGENGVTLYPPPCKSNGKQAIYKYLLLATRLNMKSDRIHAGIDGTLLFEELSAEASRDYFGDRSESMVFGTSDGSSRFEEKVDCLCANIKEGNGYEPKGDKQGHERDGKLDVVAWKHFSDGFPGKVIAFGQCKSGSHYSDDAPNLRPDSFCAKWMHSRPALVPLRMFFIAEALHQGDFYNLASDAGLLFDRCRIVDYSNQVRQCVMTKVEDWTVAAANATGLPSR